MSNKKTVSSRNDILTKNMEDRELLKLLKNGKNALLINKSKYIPRKRGENESDYADRLYEMKLVNILQKTISDYVSKLFKKPLNIIGGENESDESKEKIEDIKINFNGFGTDINEFMKNFALESLWFSQGHIFVDYTRDSSGEFRHMISILDLDCLLDFKYTLNELTYLRFYIIETDENEDDNDYENNRRYVIKEFRKRNGKVTWSDFVADDIIDGDDDVDSFKYTKRNIDQVFISESIPLVSFYPNSSISKFNPDLVFKDVADLQLSHMLNIGAKDFLQSAVSQPILVITGDNIIDDDDESGGRVVEMNSRSAIQLPNNGADIKWVSADQGTIQTLMKSIEYLEEQIQTLTNSLLVKKGAITATEIAVNENKNNASLYSISLMLRKGVSEKIIDYILKWQGLDIEYKTTITSDFSIEIDKTEFKEFLDTALLNNVISKKTYMKELQKRGVIDEDIIYDDEQDLIKESADVFSMENFGDKFN